MNWHDRAGMGPPGASCNRPDDAESRMISSLPDGCVVISAYKYREVVLRQLSFPYAVSVDLEQQTAWCNDRSVSRTLLPGRRTILPSLTRFDLHLSANASVRIQVQVGNDLASPVVGNSKACAGPTFGITNMGSSSRQARKPLTHSLARCVFIQPGRNWTRHEFAALLRLSTGDVSRLLFSEGECMRETVRTSRLCRFLVDLPNLPKVDNRMSDAYGFNYLHLLEEAVYEYFGVTLATLTALVGQTSDFSPWHIRSSSDRIQ
ncbi:hypothetical protein LJR296_006869 [Cupriavidus necator]|uniref:hypothetical protein n=1 Tax=Cupriavidus necator TaxID=106590 RepID=UPI003ED03D74